MLVESKHRVSPALSLAPGSGAEDVSKLERFPQRLLQFSDALMEVSGPRRLGKELVEQLSLSIRQAEDFARDCTDFKVVRPIHVSALVVHCQAIQGGAGRSGVVPDAAGAGRELDAAGVVNPSVFLQVAANPFNFWPLIERGLSEWGRTSDALIDGAPFPGAPGLFWAGLGSGALDLFLGRLRESGDEAVDSPIHDPLLVEGDGQSVEVNVGVPVQLFQEGRGQRAAHLFDIVSVFHGYLQGHLLWVAPELRGRGLVGGYFDAALDVARRHGLKGFMFLSTLLFWERRAPRYGFIARFRITQDRGPDAIGWFREVC